jgi:hypothetical protein
MTQNFFEAFEDARHQLTIGDEDDPERNVLQPGLVAVFFMDKAYERREAIAQALKNFCQRYGDKLKWGYFTGNMKDRQWSDADLSKCLDYIRTTSPMEAVEFRCSSEAGFGYVGEYGMNAYSPAGWYEQVHKPLSHVRFYLPVEQLKDGGVNSVQEFLLELCGLLKPLHGYMGLGIQQSYEHEDFQAMEYELAQEFNGLDVGNPAVGSKTFRGGFKSVNWYTILDDQWVSKLGGVELIRSQLNDERIQLLPYSHGLVVKAGEWPELGWIKKNPFPELYVKVNRVLKPARAPEVQSFHYGSVAGEARFGPRSSNEWLRRFDDAPETQAKPVKGSGKVVRLKPAPADTRGRCEAGQPCPREGHWFTPAQAGSRRFFKAGEVMPEVGGDYGLTIWQWDEASQRPPKL